MTQTDDKQNEETDLDQRVFLLEPEAHRRFLALLDAPPRLSDEARALLTGKPPWEL
jgi:uncharacterized protein (DUF1778 family)